MPLSEHVYCVAITFRMTEQVEQRICIKFCVKLQHSSMETIRMIQKATAMGKWWLAASSWQRAHSCITTSVIFGKTSNPPGDSAPPHPRFGALWLLAFPKTQISSERDHWRVLSGFIGCDNLWNLHYFWLPWPVLKGPIQVICRMF